MKKLFILVSAAILFAACYAEESKARYEKLAAEDAVKEEAKKAELLKELNPSGIWTVGNFNDRFGNKTEDKFIICQVNGTFSNSATKNSPLKVYLIYTKGSGLGIELYEYAGNNPEKILDFDKMTIYVQDKDKNQYTFEGNIQGQRNYFKNTKSAKIENILSAGGTVKFRIDIESRRGSIDSSYAFDIIDARGFDVALTELK